MVDQYHRYIYTAMHNVGGIRLDNSRRSVGEGTRFVSTPASVQEASLRWVLRELSDCDWLVMKAHATGYPLGYYQNYMQETLFESMRKRLISLCARGDPVVLSGAGGAFHGRGLPRCRLRGAVGKCRGAEALDAVVPHHAASQHRPAQLEDQGDGRSRAVHAGLCADDADLELFGLDRAAAEESASLGKGYAGSRRSTLRRSTKRRRPSSPC